MTINLEGLILDVDELSRVPVEGKPGYVKVRIQNGKTLNDVSFEDCELILPEAMLTPMARQ